LLEYFGNQTSVESLFYFGSAMVPSLDVEIGGKAFRSFPRDL
jgi:hypothetical protein